MRNRAEDWLASITRVRAAPVTDWGSVDVGETVSVVAGGSVMSTLGVMIGSTTGSVTGLAVEVAAAHALNAMVLSNTIGTSLRLIIFKLHNMIFVDDYCVFDGKLRAIIVKKS